MITDAQKKVKAYITNCVKMSGKSIKDISEDMGCQPTHLRRIMDMGHSNSFDTLESALGHFGKRLDITIGDL